MRKIYIQLVYGENDYHWNIVDKKDKKSGKLADNEYHNYLTETIAKSAGYQVVHGSCEKVGSVEDLNEKVRYETYTLQVK